MTDDLPESVDDVLARAARMGRPARDARGTPSPAGTPDLSLNAVAAHARQESLAAAHRVRAGSRPVTATHNVSRPTDGATPSDTATARKAVGSQFAASTACQSAVIAALHDVPVLDISTAVHVSPPLGAHALDKGAASCRIDLKSGQLIARNDSGLAAFRRPAFAAIGMAVHAAFGVGNRFATAANALFHRGIAAVRWAVGLATAHPRNGSVFAGGVLVVCVLITVAQSPHRAFNDPTAKTETPPLRLAVPTPTATLPATPRAAPPVAPTFDVVTDTSDLANTSLTQQLLAAANAPATADENVPVDGWLASLLALGLPARMTVARYDALQAARLEPASADMPALQVIAPLTLEPVYAVVRGDSPLQFMHQIQGKRINAGALQGSRSLTVSRLYRALFHAALPAHSLRSQDEASALASLQAGKVDVVVLVGAAARNWFDGAQAGGASRTSTNAGADASANASANASTSGAFKLLAFDAQHAASRKALENYLPMQAAVGSLGGFPAVRTPTIGVMSFLVTAQHDSDGDSDNAASRHAQAVSDVAQVLCTTRAAFGSSQRVDPTLQLDVGWPYAAAAQAVFARCATAGSLAARSGGTPPGPS